MSAEKCIRRCFVTIVITAGNTCFVVSDGEKSIRFHRATLTLKQQLMRRYDVTHHLMLTEIWTKPFIKKLPLIRYFSKISITHTSHDHHGVTNRRQLDCLFNSSFRITSMEHHHQAPLAPCSFARESINDRRIPLTNGQQSGKRFHTRTSSCVCMYAYW